MLEWNHILLVQIIYFASMLLQEEDEGLYVRDVPGPQNRCCSVVIIVFDANLDLVYDKLEEAKRVFVLPAADGQLIASLRKEVNRIFLLIIWNVKIEGLHLQDFG